MTLLGLGARAHGHLAVVQYLHEVGDHCNERAMDDAAANGHLEIVKCLHVNCPEGCTRQAMNKSVRRCRLFDELESRYLQLAGESDLESYDEFVLAGSTVRALHDAAFEGNLSMAKLLMEHCGKAVRRAVYMRCSGGSLDVLRYLLEERGELCTARAIQDCVGYKSHIGTLAFLAQDVYSCSLAEHSDSGARPCQKGVSESRVYCE